MVAGAGDACPCPRSASDASRCLLLWGPIGCLATGQQNAKQTQGHGGGPGARGQREWLAEQPAPPGSPLGPSPQARLGRS